MFVPIVKRLITMRQNLSEPLKGMLDYLAQGIADNLTQKETPSDGNDREVITMTDSDSKKFVYGIRGIRNRYGIGHNTACSWVAGILAPAVIRVNRSIILDTEKADKLLEQWTQEQRQRKAAR